MIKTRAKKQNILPDAQTPVYPIGVAARMIGVHPRTLRIYEAEGLFRPQYSGARRLYSQNDIQWITCLRTLIHEDGISIPGIRRLLDVMPCWEVAGCPPDIHETCEAKVDFSMNHSSSGISRP
ncbi:MAG: MerR family transcriptional regulator [Desulfobacteraceae bacterium]|nr:MerR family transcriptional regulator [Desulfobacteraceae bacterium]